MSIVVECRVCHAAHEPTREEVVSGTWKVCAACRADGAPGARENRAVDGNLMDEQKPYGRNSP